MRKRTKTPQQFQRGYAPVSFSITASIVAASIAISLQLAQNDERRKISGIQPHKQHVSRILWEP
jgi:hypothetical protein